MGLFGKKKSRDDVIAEGIAAAANEAEAAAAAQNKKDEGFNSGNAKVDMEITKIQAQLESFGEIRKSNSERFSRISEQMGELRGMIMDTNKTMSKIEVSATKAIDLVESVQPEKLMIEIRKQEGKIESLKANIESNEAMMRDIMDEIKKMRSQMNFYKGIEQVAKLNDEVKGEIFEIKKVEAVIQRHADKAETIFIDLEKKFSEYEKFQKRIEEMGGSFKLIQEEFDKMKFQLTNKSEKKEFMTLMNKFSEFEKHTGDVLKLLDERSKQSRTDLKEAISRMKSQLHGKKGFVEDDGLTGVGQEAKKPAETADPAAGTANKKENDKPQLGASGNPQAPEHSESEKKDSGFDSREENLRGVLKARKA